MVLATTLSLVAALCYASGWVMQYKEASTEASKLTFSPVLLLRLLRDPLWTLGLVTMIGGNVLQSVALDFGNLALVESILVSSLLFALVLGALWTKQYPDGFEWLGAVGLSVGLALFLSIGAPHKGTQGASELAWAATLVVVGGVSALCLYFGMRYRAVRGPLFAATGGIVFGLQDALTKSVVHQVGHGVSRLLASWEPYGMVTCAIFGLLLAQDAYKSGSLPACLPPLVILEPVVGAAIGVLAFHESLATDFPALMVEGLAICILLSGAVVLSRSPLVRGQIRTPNVTGGPGLTTILKGRRYASTSGTSYGRAASGALQRPRRRN